MKANKMLLGTLLVILVTSVALGSSWEASPPAVPALRVVGKVASTGNTQAPCVTYSTERGVRCNSPNSLEYTITNECSSGATATTWIRRSASGEWIEGSSYYLDSGESVTGWWCQEPYNWRITFKLR